MPQLATNPTRVLLLQLPDILRGARLMMSSTMFTLMAREKHRLVPLEILVATVRRGGVIIALPVRPVSAVELLLPPVKLLPAKASVR